LKLNKLIDKEESKWKTYIGSFYNYDVYIVNGNYIRKKFDHEFIMGTNFKANPEYVPHNEIWLEKEKEKNTERDTFLHETIEVMFMEWLKVDYKTAHGYSSACDEVNLRLEGMWKKI
jgi:hypothetical protein